MSLTPKDAVLFDLYSSLADRLAAGSRTAVELVAAPSDKRKEIGRAHV